MNLKGMSPHDRKTGHVSELSAVGWVRRTFLPYGTLLPEARDCRDQVRTRPRHRISLLSLSEQSLAERREYALKNQAHH